MAMLIKKQLFRSARSRLLVVMLVLALALATLAAGPLSISRAWLSVWSSASAPDRAPTSSLSRTPDIDWGNLPLSFEPNQGQTDPSVRFMAHASGGALFFTPSEVVLSLQSAPAPAVKGKPAVAG